MQIYFSKPGGQRKGPYTLEQINQDLAAKKYKDTDYWAWYEGLTEWVPLHAVPGVLDPSAAAPQESSIAQASSAPAVTPKASSAKPSTPAKAAPTASATSRPPKPPSSQVPSGLPFSALEQIFILTTGEGPEATHSPMAIQMMQDTAGADLAMIRQNVPRDVIARCTAVEQLRREGTLSDAVWRAMANYKPEVIEPARAGSYRVCVRTFVIENKDLVAVLFFYNKARLVPP